MKEESEDSPREMADEELEQLDAAIVEIAGVIERYDNAVAAHALVYAAAHMARNSGGTAAVFSEIQCAYDVLEVTA